MSSKCNAGIDTNTSWLLTWNIGKEKNLTRRSKTSFGSLKVTSVDPEKKKELYTRESEDKQRIMELQIHIKQEKEDIENDLEHLHTLEKKHNEILNYGKEPQPELEVGLPEETSPNKMSTFGDLGNETSIRGIQERLSTKGAKNKVKGTSKGKIGSKNNLSPNKKVDPTSTKLTSKTSISAQSPPKRPTTAVKSTAKQTLKPAKPKP